ncbi:MAG: helix-turn-helix domain-containing protein, partial [Candidatus Omnitrophica bacterium]|nr:helix-turn-helix domain-containing protein [Candidatus Omnitrophota bacterium]
MDQKDIIIMNQKELKRSLIIHKLIDKKLKQIEAAQILDLSTRQIRRIIKRIREEGDKGIIHRLRGRPSHRLFPQKLKDKVISLYKKKYPDFGPTLTTEKLFELNKIKISRETLRKWLIDEGLWHRQRKSRKHRFWR